MKIFADTNVIVSAFATRGLCADLIRQVVAEHDLLSAEVVLDEFERILREKMKVPAAVVSEYLRSLRYYEIEPRPQHLLTYEVPDEDDKLVLASAVNAGADILVTGDRDLLGVRDEVSELRILSPRELWDLLRPQT